MNFKTTFPLLLLMVLSVFTACWQTGEESVFVVPENYTGYVLVIYGQENGAEEEYRDKTRVYRIPSNGILLSRFPDNPGWSGFPKFYKGTIAPENEIPFVTEIKDIPTDQTSAFGGSAGGASRDLEGKDIVRYIKYYIGTQSQIKESIKELDTLDIVNLVSEQ